MIIKSITKISLNPKYTELLKRYYPGGKQVAKIAEKQLSKKATAEASSMASSTPEVSKINNTTRASNKTPNNAVQEYRKNHANKNTTNEVSKNNISGQQKNPEFIRDNINNNNLNNTPISKESSLIIYNDNVISNNSNNYAQNYFRLFLKYLNDQHDIEKTYKGISAYVNNKIKHKEEIPEKVIEQFLSHVDSDSISYNEKENIMHILREYFKTVPPNIKIGENYLRLWKKGNYEYIPPAIVNKKEIDLPNKNNIAIKQKDSRTYEEKLQDALIERNKNISEMTKMLDKCANNPKDILNSEELKEWYKYLKKSGNVLAPSDEEHFIDKILKEIYIKNAPNMDDVLKNIKDPEKYLKDKSTLPSDMKEPLLDKLFTSEDYTSNIKKIKNALHLLNDDKKTLSIEDLQMLSLRSNAAVVDDEGTFKLTEDAYKAISENKIYLEIEDLDTYPNSESIMKKISIRDYVIVNNSTDLPGTIIDAAHISHKTLVIYDDSIGKNIYIRLGVLTSSKSDSTVSLDEYQRTNTDPEKQLKNQMFRAFQRFMVVDENEPLDLDIETTLLFYYLNTFGDSFSEILYDLFESKKDIWSKNPYQCSYQIDQEFLSKLVRIYFEKELQKLEQELHKFEQELDILKNDSNDNSIQLFEKTKLLNTSKQKYLEDKQHQQYISSLPKEFRLIHKINKIFESKVEFYNKRQKEKDIKQEKQKFMELQKKVLNKEKQQETQIFNAKKKKEDYLAAKKTAKNINKKDE